MRRGIVARAGRMWRMSSEPPNPSSASADASVHLSAHASGHASGQKPAGHNTVNFGGPPPERTPFPVLPWAVAGAVVMLVALVAILLGGHRRSAAPANTREQDDYGSRLVFSDLKMSESTSLSGGKSTFIDGQVRNSGDQTVAGVTVQVAFGNDEALPPQTITLPLTLIRAHEPYVDTVPVSEAPLAPGSQREFRLIFEGIGANWNQQLPAIRVTQVLVPCNPCR